MYKNVYKKESFSEELLKATRGIGLQPTIEDINNYILFVKKRYDISVDVKVTLENNKQDKNGGCYIDYKKEIIFYGELNLITVLHEIRHYIQFNSSIKPLFKTYNDREEEARAWSSSLFYALYPETYDKLSEEGKIKFI